jgi:hypothetical protein
VRVAVLVSSVGALASRNSLGNAGAPTSGARVNVRAGLLVDDLEFGDLAGWPARVRGDRDA